MSELHDINAIHADALDAELAGDGDLHTLVEPLLHLLAAVAAHEPGPWVERAACRDLPTAWWFPTRGDPTDTAMTICHTCPVQSECTEHALAIGNDAFGIWGGLSRRKREAERRRRGSQDPRAR